MCHHSKINVTTTLEDQSIHVEQSDDPHTLLYAVEGEDPGPVARLAWGGYISHHPPQSLHLHLPAALPARRLDQVLRAFEWLLRKIVQGREEADR